MLKIAPTERTYIFPAVYNMSLVKFTPNSPQIYYLYKRERKSDSQIAPQR